MTTSKPTLYFIRGLPGSGKSTFADVLSKSLLAQSYEADDLFYNRDGDYCFDKGKLPFAHLYCQRQCEIELVRGYDVIISNTSTTEKEVQTYKDIADKAGANFVSLIVENRHEGKSVHDVPEETIAKMKNRFSIKL